MGLVWMQCRNFQCYISPLTHFSHFKIFRGPPRLPQEGCGRVGLVWRRIGHINIQIADNLCATLPTFPRPIYEVIKGYLRRGVVRWDWFGGGAAAASSQWQPGHLTSSRSNPPVSKEISNLSKKVFCLHSKLLTFNTTNTLQTSVQG